jgi:proteasome lid subunit RPN8/RPN11
MVGNMRAIVMQVEPGTVIDTMVEMYVMTPYRHSASYIGPTHRISVLHSHPDYPAMLLIAPLSDPFDDFL